MGCINYHGISLVNLTYKIFTQLVAQSLKPYVEQIIADHQFGFLRDWSTTDSIFSLRTLQKSYNYNVDIHQLYINYKQAIASISRDQLKEIMKVS